MRYLLYFTIIAVGFGACDKKAPHHRISAHGATAESVFLTHDENDNTVIVWTEKADDTLTLFYAISIDGGKTFPEKVTIPIPQDAATHAESMPKVAFKNDGTVIAAYERKTPTKENKYAGSITFISSSDKGKSWSTERYLHNDTVAGRSRSYFDIERLPDGEIGASWLDIKLDNGTGGRSVRFAKTRGANEFSDEILIDSSACQCCRIDVHTDQSQNVFIAYRGLKKGKMGKQIRDMMIATSLDQGASFSSPVLISADNWNIEGCPHTGPSLCSNKAGLFSLWYTEGTGTGVFISQMGTTDNGFTPKQLVSAEGHHPQLCSNEDRIAMLWEENANVDGKSKTIVKYRIVRDGREAETGALTPIGVNAFLPVVTRCEDGFLAAYLAERDGKVGVYFRRF